MTHLWSLIWGTPTEVLRRDTIRKVNNVLQESTVKREKRKKGEGGREEVGGLLPFYDIVEVGFVKGFYRGKTY